jgi:hypothetical protein
VRRKETWRVFLWPITRDVEVLVKEGRTDDRPICENQGFCTCTMCTCIIVHARNFVFCAAQNCARARFLIFVQHKTVHVHDFRFLCSTNLCTCADIEFCAQKFVIFGKKEKVTQSKK